MVFKTTLLTQVSRRKFLRDSAHAGAGVCLAGFGMEPYARQVSQAVPNEEGILKAAISVQTRAVLHRIDPNIYGAFIEHVGRCVYGGVYQENSLLSDENGFRKDVMEAAAEWDVPILRWPGGIFASYYHWEDGVGPKGSRPRRENEAWLEEETNHFGTDEFIQYCRKIGAEPYICVNLLNGTAHEAANWVEYCNGTANTPYANLRRKYGHKEPHNVRYWGLGNELWRMRGNVNGLSAEDYAKFAFECGKLMKSIDPSIQLVAIGLPGFPPPALAQMGFDLEWNRVVLEKLVNIADYLSMHEYAGNDDYYEELGSIRLLEDAINSAAAEIKASDSMRGKDSQLAGALPGIKTKKPIEISVDEWNIWYRKHDLRRPDVPNPVEEKYNLRDALWSGSVLNLFQRTADKVTMANVATMVNAIGTIFTSDQGVFRQTIYFPLKLYRRECGAQALGCKVQSPAFSSKSFHDVPYVDVSATLDTDRKNVAIAVVNRHQSKPISTTIDIGGVTVGSNATVFEINGASPEIENSFSEPENVRIVQREMSKAGNKLEYVFPAHSITLLKMSLT